MSKVCVFFGTGFEEIEALAVVDLLRRESIETDMVSITDERTVEGSHGIRIEMDKVLGEVDFESTDVIVLPGGGVGTKNLEACAPLMEQVDAFVAAGKTVCAICAAPMILGKRGLLDGYRAVCFPGFEKYLTGAAVDNSAVAVDRRRITACGMGAAAKFGAALVAAMKGEEVARSLWTSILADRI